MSPSEAVNIVDFEYDQRARGTSRPTKVREIRERLGYSESTYLALLGRAITTTAALFHRPALVRCLRRERDDRRAVRTGPRATSIGPDPRQPTFDDMEGDIA